MQREKRKSVHAHTENHLCNSSLLRVDFCVDSLRHTHGHLEHKRAEIHQDIYVRPSRALNNKNAAAAQKKENFMTDFFSGA